MLELKLWQVRTLEVVGPELKCYLDADGDYGKESPVEEVIEFLEELLAKLKVKKGN